MKKLIYTVAILAVSLTAVGQEKGSFLTIAGGVGGGGFQYKPQGIYSFGIDKDADSTGTNKDKFGWNAHLGYSYFFTPNWGIATGVGISYYRTIGKIHATDFTKEDYLSMGKYVDDDFVPGAPTNFDLRIRMKDWQEQQKGYFIEIPLMLRFQYKLGATRMHGFYAGLGAKLQIPIIESTYSVLDGKSRRDPRLNVSGQYDSYIGIDGRENFMPDMGNPADFSIPVHGFGSIHNPGETFGWKGDLNLKMSIAGTAELGFLFGLSRRVDLMVGGYFDYGFNNIKKGADKAFLEAPTSDYQPDANNNIGKGIGYNGYVNSDKTNKVNLMAYGGRIGLQIKLGKLDDYSEPEPLPEEPEDDDDDLLLLQQQLEAMQRLLQELLAIEDDPEPDFVGIRGTVYNSETKEIIPDAIVELIDARTNRLVAITKSDENGVYKIPMEDFGRYILEVRKEGYLYSSEEIVVPQTAEPQVVEKDVYLDQIKEGTKIILKNIFFDTGKSTLKPASMNEIDMVYKLMVDNPTMQIELSGHTDNVGSAEMNKKLSLARASVVVKELVKRGISADRMTSVGYGLDQPIAPNTTAAGRAENRRTEFKVTKM
jgi:outer membrane protein OmpA-like peptidoglycan-associated protein